ncbi:MAG: hypothetical protein LBK05_05895, partial [Treponema sp.]|nr:hypothetical protein [Treponema sp.]
MSLFCIFWTPLVLLLWAALNPGRFGNSGGIWAFFLGILVSVLHYFFYPLAGSSGFGLSLWVYTLADIVLIPVLPAFLLFALFAVLGFFKDEADPAGFALSALIPAGAVRAAGWNGQNSPLYFVVIPLLWTSLALGVSFLVRLARGSGFPRVIPLLAAILAMPAAAAACFWAFYRQMAPAGF